MATNPIAQQMEQMVATYFDACRKLDAKAIAACFTPGAVHYFPHAPPAYGGEEIAELIVQLIRDMGGEYFIDKMFTSVEQHAAAVEWSRTFNEKNRIVRGYEFYEFDPETLLIREIRGYFAAPVNAGQARNELVGFDYTGRGYKTLSMEDQ
jgi:methyltransferase